MTRQTRGQHAIVIGGSIAGLMTARVLADHFGKVTIIERDTPNLVRPEMRKGTPQGAHYHVLLQGGLSLLTELFPGFVDRLNSLGSRSTRAVRDIAYHTPHGIAHSQSGSVKVPRDLGYNVQCQSRPLLEFCIRASVLEVSNISFSFGTTVSSLIHAEGRVSGVRVSNAEGAAALEADFVIDAGGRSARTPRWLADGGYEAPEETRLQCDLAYSSTKVRIPEKYRDWPYNLNVFYPPLPNKTGAMMHHIEDGLWHVSLEGRLGAYPPKDAAGFMEFVRTFYTPTLHEMIKDAERVTEVSHFHFSYSVLRHYERLQRFPDNLLVIGDGICSVNPVHGQGMSSSALQVRVLRGLIDECEAAGHGLEGMSRTFFARAAKAVQQPWMLAALKDFQFEGTPGERPEGFENMVQYMGAIEALIADDAELHQAVADVMQLVAPMDTLFQEPWKGRIEAYLGEAAQVATRAWDKGPAGVMGPDEGRTYWQPAPTGGWVTLKYTPATFAFDAAACGIQVIPPGGRLPERALRASELIWYVISGSATALLDGKVHRLEGGSSVALGRQVPHSLENDGVEDLRLFFWVTPPGYEEILACIGRPGFAGDAAPAPFTEPDVNTGALSSPLLNAAEMRAIDSTSGRGRVTVVGANEGTAAHWQSPPARGYIQMKFTSANVATNRFGTGLQVLPPGGMIPPHAHTSNEEFLLVVRGRGHAIVDDVPTDIEVGSIAFVSRWVKHTLVNTGDENMHILAILTPLGGLDKVISMPGFAVPVVPGEPEPDWAGFDMTAFDEQEAAAALANTCLNLPFQVEIHNREAAEPAALRPITA